MIDIENTVFDTVATALRALHSGISVYGEYVDTPASFPAVTIVETDNRVIKNWRTAENIENAALLLYEVNVYSNRSPGKKAQAKSIMNDVDDAFAGLGFTRTFRDQIPNIADATIYRIVARYDGIVIPNDDGKFYIYSN